MKNKQIKAVVILLVLNIAVYAAYGAMHYTNIKNMSADTNVYVANERTTDDIVSIQSEGTDGSFAINFNGTSWTVEGKENFPISSDALSKLIEKANNLTAARKISSDGDYEKYGLDNPKTTITVTDSQGTSIKYVIGNFNENINRYYVCEEGSKDIYIINKSVGDQLTADINSYAAAFDLSDLSRSTLSTLEIVNGESDTVINKGEKDDNNPLGSSSQWTFGKPFSSSVFVDVNKIDTIIIKLKNAAASQCVMFSPTESDLENYGLRDSRVYYSLNYSGKNVKMYMGKTNDDGSAYISFDGSSIVGLADSETVSALKEYLDPYKYLPQSVCTAKKAAVDSIEAVLDGKTYNIDMSKDNDSVTAFFNKLSGIVSSSHSIEAENVQPNDSSFIITYHFKDSAYADITVYYTPYDNDYYTASCGEVSGRLVNKRSIESVIDLLKAVEQ